MAMEASAGVTSYREMNGHCYHMSGTLTYHPNTADIAELSPDGVSDHSLSSGSSKSSPSSISAAFDEEFLVNGEEEVKTPCTSPTLDELPNSIKSSSKTSSIHSIFESSKPEHFNFVTKSLTETALRPCQYTLDKRYDESIPVHTIRRSMRENLKLGAEKLGARPFTPVRRLEDIVSSPLSPLPRMTSYSSSSGSLIGNISRLSFEPDEFALASGLSLVNGVSDALSNLDNPNLLKGFRSVEISHALNGVLEHSGPQLCEVNASNSCQVNGNVDSSENLPPTTVSQPSPYDDLELLKALSTVEDLETQSLASDTGDSNTSRLDKSRKSSVKSKHSKRSRRSRATVQTNPPFDDPTDSISKLEPAPHSVTDHLQPEAESRRSDSPTIAPPKDVEEQSPDLTNGVPSKCHGSTSSDLELPMNNHPYIPDQMAGNVEDTLVADSEFTLVTTKKHKRQQKVQQQLQLQKQQQQRWIPPVYPSRNSVHPLNSTVRPSKPLASNNRISVVSTQAQSFSKPSLPSSQQSSTCSPRERRKLGNFNRPKAEPVGRSVPNMEPRRSHPDSSTGSQTSLSSVTSSQLPNPKPSGPLTTTSIHPTKRNSIPTSANSSSQLSTIPSNTVCSTSNRSSRRLTGIRPAQFQMLQNFMLTSWNTFKQRPVEA